VVGRSQVWIDGKLAGEKRDTEKKGHVVACPGALASELSVY
jgi:hypothetical protein